MMTLYVFRERIRSIYQKYELYLEPIIKFVFGLVVFLLINKSIGFYPKLTKLPVVLVLSLVSAFVPYAVTVLLSAAVAFAHVYYASKILSIIVLLIMLILYLLFMRFTPKYGIVVLAIPILYLWKIPYMVPLLLGIVATPVAAVAAGCGVIVYYMFLVIKDAASVQVGISLEDALQIYKYVCDGLVKNKQMIMTIIIFILVLIITYAVRRLKIDFAYEIAIAVGAISCTIFFLIGDLSLDTSEQILSTIIGTIISALIVYVVLFFKQALDYTAVENSQFEDDDYIYYVKAVPKITVTTPQKNVKRINPQDDSNQGNNLNEYEEDYDYQYENEYDEEMDDFKRNQDDEI